MYTRNFKTGVVTVVQDPNGRTYPYKLVLAFRDGDRHRVLEKGYKTLAGAARGLKSRWVAKVMRQRTPFDRMVEFQRGAHGKSKKDAQGLAATIGRAVYGKQGFATRAQAGRASYNPPPNMDLGPGLTPLADFTQAVPKFKPPKLKPLKRKRKR